VLATFDALAKAPGCRAVSGIYRKRVPLGVPLTLAHTPEAPVHRFAVSDADGSVLVDGRVEPLNGAGQAGIGADAPVHGSPTSETQLHALPISRTCFVCGTDNPVGLGVRLAVDAQAVWGTWTPRPPFREDNGTLAPAALTSVLDEAAFWLGALVTGESGMTTDLRVVLHRSVPFETAITVIGGRGAVQPHPGDHRYWNTAVAAYDAAGVIVASARITFVAVRGAARRLVSGMLSINDPDIVRRVFPAYVPSRV